MKKVFTSGQVAKLCNVAPRTVSKWFDSKRLNGYRIPGSNDRRIPRDELLRFMKEYGLPTDALESEETFGVLVIGASAPLAARLKDLLESTVGAAVTVAPSAFAAGVLVRDLAPNAVVIDLSVGRSEGLEIARSVRADSPRVLLYALAGEDETAPEQLIVAGFTEVYQQPADLGAIAKSLNTRRELANEPAHVSYTARRKLAADVMQVRSEPAAPSV